MGILDMLYKAERRNRHGEENRAGAENGSTGAIQRGIADSKGLPVVNHPGAEQYAHTGL